LSYVPICE